MRRQDLFTAPQDPSGVKRSAIEPGMFLSSRFDPSIVIGHRHSPFRRRSVLHDHVSPVETDVPYLRDLLRPANKPEDERDDKNGSEDAAADIHRSLLSVTFDAD